MNVQQTTPVAPEIPLGVGTPAHIETLGTIQSDDYLEGVIWDDQLDPAAEALAEEATKH